MNLERLNEIQREHLEWRVSNFGVRTKDNGHWPILGLLEEIGEYVHAVLKSEQGIRGSEEVLGDQRFDALGDAAIYLMDCITSHGSTLSTVAEYAALGDPSAFDGDPSADVAETRKRKLKCLALLTYYVSSLLQLVGKPDLTFRSEWFETHAKCWRQLEILSFLECWSLEEVLEQTWLEVRQRDWKKNSVDGKVAADGA